MPKPPKSPLEKPSSGKHHTRRPSTGRRTSSSDKLKKESTGSSQKHGVKAFTDSTAAPKVSTKTSIPSGLLPMTTDNTNTKRGLTVGYEEGRVKANAADTVEDSNQIRETVPEHNTPVMSPSSFLGATPSGFTTQEEIDRLRAAMDAQLMLNQQRDNLSKQNGARTTQVAERPSLPAGKSRVSPIREEVSAAMSPSLDAAFASPLDTASTESNKTIREGTTPGVLAARTPSYPFPPMKTPRNLSWTSHRPFTALSPTVPPQTVSGGTFELPINDMIPSGSVTPASTMTFQPPSAAPFREDVNFPTPNLYELSLSISSEPGLEPWWTTVCQIMKDVYRADRVTLSVPADATDIENVPWGQKATFNIIPEDSLSLTYLPRGSSLAPSSGDGNDVSFFDSNEVTPALSASGNATRPGLFARHSFAAYEDSKREPLTVAEGHRSQLRQPVLSRTQSYSSGRPDRQVPRSKTLKNAELSLASLEEHLAFEDAKRVDSDFTGIETRKPQGRVFPVLQALDYEADPLVDSSGVIRVLERGKVIALTRDYPYLDVSGMEDETREGSKGSKASKTIDAKVVASDAPPRKPELQTRWSSFMSKNSRVGGKNSHPSFGERSKASTSMLHVDEKEASSPTARYEEYEQMPPSPWSQSPAPSPAIRADPNENPFFADAPVDEVSFNPSMMSQDYSQPIEAIGVDRSCTVLHIPLIHPLLSKLPDAPRMDAAALEPHSKQKNNEPSTSSGVNEQTRRRHSPIAILSISSSTTPYPSNIRHSLEHLSPHLATSFSLCRHYTNLETEIAGLSRKRPHISGFGAVATGGPSGNSEHVSQNENDPRLGRSTTSTADSVTSPSDYSGVSRSTGGSPVGTPGWGYENLSVAGADRGVGSSPGYVSGDSYFTSRIRPPATRTDTGSGTSASGVRQSSKDTSPPEPRQGPRGNEERSLPDQAENHDMFDANDGLPLPSPSKHVRIDRSALDSSKEDGAWDVSLPGASAESAKSSRRQALRSLSAQGAQKSGTAHSHTQLHSYGADFSSTFQSLPNTTTGGPMKSVSGPAATREVVDMPPPSDRLKTLMLDTLPAHLFVALPQTGEIVWVNNRYLTYRGQTVENLKGDPWGSIHPDELDSYLKEWRTALRTGEQFSMQVRIRRFDGNYRWFYTRAVGGRDTRGVIVQWYGSYMDIHDQHIAEVKAARQEEIEASEAKHRLLANLIPQIIFAATEHEGVTFANEQWLSYTGQDYNDALGLGFMDFVHPDDLAKCRIPTDRPPTPSDPAKKRTGLTRNQSEISSTGKSSDKSSDLSDAPTETTVKGVHELLSRNNSSNSGSVYELPTADLADLARNGVIKITADGNGRQSYTTEVRLKNKTGEYRWHLVRCVEVDNINFGSGDGSWFGACTDINDHKILEAALKDAMDSKSKFLSNMSHEIRTPLIGISGMVSFLQDTILTDEQSDYTNTIATSASSLLMIINDILDLSKVDSGMMKLHFEWFHPSSLIEDVHELLSTMAIQKHVELNYVVDEDVPEMLKGDKFRIRQVLLNIVGNAIKFTSEGEVFTSCHISREHNIDLGASEVILKYQVVDTGSGFSEEQKQKMFKPFSQVDGSTTRAAGGTGLGLVISRTLVELHGGQMDGHGVPNQGATFSFTVRVRLPTDDDQPPPVSTPMPEPEPAQTSRRRSFNTIELSARAMKSAGGNPAMVHRIRPSGELRSPAESISTAGTFTSSASSDPSLRSVRTERSSASSISHGFSHFGEAARNSQPDLSDMKLAIPEKGSLSTTPSESSVSKESWSPSKPAFSGEGIKHFRPPMYSILIVCPQTHSREATARHIEMTLPKDIPHQITSLGSAREAHALIGGIEKVIFTHIILNLGDYNEIILLIEEIFTAISLPQTSIVILSDPLQRQQVIKSVPDYDYDQLAKDNRVNFVFKPVKPSRFAVIFDPDKERDLSTDRNRSTAQQQVATQKQNYIDAEKRLGNRGHIVLLVEDNLVNQKVLIKYLGKVGVDVEVANDGVECTDLVFAKPNRFYSLILCDLHMPRKDGYQTCRDIREWEAKNGYPKMPVIALSANVMSDVMEKCNDAGFNSYVTKPVDFKSLTNAMGKLLDPTGFDV